MHRFIELGLLDFTLAYYFPRKTEYYSINQVIRSGPTVEPVESTVEPEIGNQIGLTKKIVFKTLGAHFLKPHTCGMCYEIV